MKQTHYFLVLADPYGHHVPGTEWAVSNCESCAGRGCRRCGNHGKGWERRPAAGDKPEQSGGPK